jgi:MFS family permease
LDFDAGSLFTKEKFLIPDTDPPSSSVFKEYLDRVRAFKPNARFYLLSALLTGMTMGVFRLLFNFFVLSLGFDEALIGKLISTSSFTALILALPMGYLVNIFGRKQALIARSLILGASVVVISVWPTVVVFFLMNAMFGVSQSLSSVAMGPFLMENSDEKERTYLFSFSSGIRMASVFVGNWVGGYLPAWVSNVRDVSPTSSSAYSGALMTVGILGLLGIIPMLLIKQSRVRGTEGSKFSPLSFAAKHPLKLSKILLPSLFVSVGAGFFVPFMNIYFRQVHNQPDPVIGKLMAWGSLAMGIGLLIAPPIADRVGKIRLVAITQGLSIPFMLILGFAPYYVLSAGAYFIRMALMNMSNPIFDNFVLEQFDKSEQATVASLTSLIWASGRAFSPSISGSLQVSHGFGPPFMIAITLYACAVTLYWVFFIRGGRAPRPVRQRIG